VVVVLLIKDVIEFLPCIWTVKNSTHSVIFHWIIWLWVKFMWPYWA